MTGKYGASGSRGWGKVPPLRTAIRQYLILLVVLVLFSVLLAADAFSQRTQHLPLGIERSDAKSLSMREVSLQKGGRFLGWKFSSKAQQDTRKWIRPQPPVTGQLGMESPNFSMSPAQAAIFSGTTSLGNVGLGFRQGLPSGFIPTAVTYGDFNEDGKMDFAVSNGGDNTIYMFLGNGDDTFQVPEVLYTQGQAPNWITAVRLHTNGHLDLAVTDGDSNTVEIFPGHGDGTFGASTQVSLPQIPSFILAADANNDGNQDLVIGLVIDQDATEPQFEVLLGNGAGGFTGTLFSPAISGSIDGPDPTNWIAAGDINKDGFIDFLTTAPTGPMGPFSMAYLNQSGKSFLVGSPLAYNDSPVVMGLGDMDEDGCLDAVQLGGLGLVTVAKGSCDGNFDPNPNVIAMVGDLDPAIAIADVNGDGHLDVVGSAVYYQAGFPGVGEEAGYLVSVLKGDGKGNLIPAQVYRGGTNAYSLVVADFKGVGRPDILTADSLENSLTLFSNDGNGNYGSPEGETIGYPNGIGPINAPDSQSAMETADLNGDGKPDLLLVEYPQVGGGPAQLTAILNDGTGNFLQPLRSPLIGEVSEPVPVFITGAFRNPASPDVIYVNTFSPTGGTFNVLYLAGNGDGTFRAPVILATLASPQQIVAGDFNKDGKLDFAVLGVNGTGQNWELDIFWGHGDGTFTHLAPQMFPLPISYQNSFTVISPQQLFAIDLNHDGNLDLLVGLNGNVGDVASGDDLVEMLGNGDGTFQAPTILLAHFGAVAVADVNHDGYPDLIQARDPNTNIAQSLFSEPGVTVYLGSANGVFMQQPSYDLPGVTIPSFNPALVGDFNGDGIPDIAIRYWVTIPTLLIEPRLCVLQGVGDGTFIVTGHQYQLQGTSFPFVGADFNGDGMTDLVELTGLTSSFHTIPAAPGSALDIALDSEPLLGNNGTATVVLDLPAGSAQTVALSASDPAINLPTSAHFAAGQQSQTFSFTLGPRFDATHVFALYAKLGTQTAVAYGTKANSNLITGVIAQINQPGSPLVNVSVEPGESFQMAYGLVSQGGYSGDFSSLKCGGLPAGASCLFDTASLSILPGGSAGAGITIYTSSSTPLGMNTVTVSSTDGSISPAASFQLGIGDFSFNVTPNPIVVGPSGNAVATIIASSTNGLGEQLAFSCTGLPAGTQCGPNNIIDTNGGTGGFGVSHNQLVPNDYPFQITGTADIVSHSINEVLRVGDFTASLDKTTATLSKGQSATFTLTLTSVNHYTSTITTYCQSPSASVTCTLSGSPATLTDGGTASVQLVINNASSVGTMTRPAAHNARVAYIFSFLLPTCLLLLPRKRATLVISVVVCVIGFSSCGGGGNGGTGGTVGGGGGGGGSGVGGGSQQVSVSVIAQAATTVTDSFNQKTLPPIVITLN